MNNKNTTETRTTYSTNFRNINNNIGFNVYSDKGDLIQTNKGILSGSKVLFIGEPHTGKSTLCYNIVANSTRKLIEEGEDVRIFLIDTETGTNKNRFRHICNLSDSQIDKHVWFEDDVSLENLCSVIDEEIKRKREKDYKKYKTKNTSGEEVEMYLPTYIVVDSFAEIISRDLMEIGAKDPKNFSMRVGNDRKVFFMKYNPYFKQYNINLFMVTHIADNIQMSALPGSQPSRKYGGMSGTKKILGGKNMEYQTDIIIYLEKYVVYNDKSAENKRLDWMESSHIVSALLLKNRQAKPNINFYLVLDSEMGFNPMKSLIYECLELDIIKSAGAYKSLNGFEKKFRASEILDLYYNNTDDFRKLLHKEYDEYKKDILDSMKRNEETIQRTNSILKFIDED